MLHHEAGFHNTTEGTVLEKDCFCEFTFLSMKRSISVFNSNLEVIHLHLFFLFFDLRDIKGNVLFGNDSFFYSTLKRFTKSA